MRFSVCESSTPALSFAEDLVVFRKAGAEGIGLDLNLKPIDPIEDLARFRDSDLQATFCFPSPWTVLPSKRHGGSGDPAERVKAICEDIQMLSKFEPECIVSGVGPFAGHEAGEAWAVAIDSLRTVADCAADVGLRVVVEPMHKSIGEAWSFLTDIPDSLTLLDEIDRPNVGLLFDVWHLWDTAEVHALLGDNVERVFAVHVDDWRSPTRSWADRVLPGDGVADVAGFLRILREGGYDGWLELEILSDNGTVETAFPDSLWAQDPAEMIRDGRERIERLWTDAGTAIA